MNIFDSAIAASLDVSQVQMLSQLSEEAFWDYARQLASIVPIVHARSTEQRTAVYAEYLECVLSKGRYLFPLAALYEVVPPPRHYTFLPGRPVWMSGLAVWRGVPLAVIDLPLYLTGNTSKMNSPVFSSRLLIAHDDDLSLGFLVYSTGGIIAASDVLPIASDDALSTDNAPGYVPARNSVIAGRYADAVVLDVPALLADIVRQLTIATP